MLLVASVLAVLVGFWAQTQSTVNVNLFRTLNDLSGNMVGLAKGVYALGSIWAVLAVTRRAAAPAPVARARWHAALAGAGAWGSPLLLNELLGTHAISGLGVNVRIGDGPVYPVANVAAITALAFGIAPYIVRPLRRIFAVVIVLVSLGRDVPRRRVPGRRARRRCSWASRSPRSSGLRSARPAGSPSVAEVQRRAHRPGLRGREHRPADERIAARRGDGRRARVRRAPRVDAFGRDQRDARIAAKLWHKAMYHDPGVPVFGSRIQQVEHIGFTLMLAERADVPAARLVRTGVGGADAARARHHAARRARRSARSPPSGSPTRCSPPRGSELDQLHHGGISHGNLDGLRVRRRRRRRRSRSTTSARPTRPASSTGATATTPRCSC